MPPTSPPGLRRRCGARGGAGTPLDHCAPYPSTVTPLSPDQPLEPRLQPRDTVSSTIWFTPHSKTYIIITLHNALASISPTAVAISTLLREASAVVLFRIGVGGDGVIPQGQWMYQSGTTPSGTPDMLLGVRNAGNHQTTWGVLNAALVAVSECMQEKGWGPAVFDIYDGENQVGTGVIV